MMKKVILLAPSGAIDPALVDGAAARLSSWGFQVEVAPHARGAYGRFSGTEEERLSDLHAALRSDADYILCARGGYGLSQIIDRVEVPEGKTPIVIGFSDITALHHLMGRYDKPSIHGAMCKAFTADPASDEGRSAEALRSLMLQQAPLAYTLPSHPLNRAGEATGRLRGGNLSLIYAMQGTPYACPVEEGDILFIEEVGEHPYAVDRMLHNLRLSGMLSKLGGLIVGQFSDYEEDPKMPYSVYEGIRRLVAPYSYPVVFNFPAGHVDYNLPLILNAPCHLSVTEASVSLDFIG